MSTVIDEKIVEMRFDNSDFEKNAQTSMKTLDTLKQSLNLEDAGKGLDSITRLSDKFNLNGITDAVQTVGDRFTALGTIATGALLRIGDQAVQTGERMLKALTIDSIKTGFEEYELKMDSVQTIMAGTGEDLQTVSKYLEELNLYADKTIYSFSDMTNSIGKFTNAGVKLPDAVAAIQGIANEAAVSGANAQQASHAMYNFAQALSSGYVKLIDWKSIENANMATVEFKKQLIESAVACGTLVKQGDKFVSTTTNMQGKISDAFDATLGFNDSLAHQWMTTEVLTKTLAKYSDETTDIGKKAFAAAQDLKTFSQMWDTLKEAAQSGWSMTMETIIGDFDEAKVLWTAVGNEISGILDAQSNERNALLKEWKSGGGRDTLLEAFSNIWKNLKDIIKPIRDAFREIFPPTTSKQLLDLTNKFNELTKKFKMSDENIQKLKDTFKGLFALIDLGVKAIKNIVVALSPIGVVVLSLGQSLLDFTSKLGKVISAFDKGGKAAGIFSDAFKGIKFDTPKFENLKETLKDVLDFIETSFIEGGEGLSGVLEVVFDIAADLTKKFFELAEGITGIDFSKMSDNAITAIQNFRNKIVGSVLEVQERIMGVYYDHVGGIKGFVFAVMEVFQMTAEGILKTFSKITGINVDSLLEKLSSGFEFLSSKLQEFFNLFKKNKNVEEGLEKDKTFIDYIGMAVEALVPLFVKIMQVVTKVISTILDGIEKIIEKMTSFASENPFLSMSAIFTVFRGKYVIEAINALKEFINVLTALVKKGLSAKEIVSAVGDSFKPMTDTVKDTFKNVNDASKNVSTVLSSVSGSFKSFQDSIKADIILKIAISIAILAASLIALSMVEVSNLAPAIGAMASLFAELVASVEILVKTLSGLDVKEVNAISKSLIKLSAAVLIMSFALSKISTIDSNSLWNSVGAIGAILGELSAALIALNKLDVKKMGLSLSIGLMAIATSVLILSNALENISTIDSENLWASVGALEALFAGLTASIVALKKLGVDKIGLSVSVALIAIAASVKMLSDALVNVSQIGDLSQLGVSFAVIIAFVGMMVVAEKELESVSLTASASLLAMGFSLKLISDSIVNLASIDPAMVAEGFFVLATSLALLVGATKFLAEGGADMLFAAGAVILLAESLKIMSDAIVALGSLQPEQMGMGLLAFAVALTGLVTAINLIPASDLIQAGIAMILLAASLEVISGVIIKFSQMNLAEIGTSLLALGGSLAIMATALKFMEGNISGAASLLIASVAIIALAGALKTMDGLDNIISSLVEIGVALAGLAVACKLMQGAIGGAAAILVAGAALILIAGAFKMMEGLDFMSMIEQVLAIAAALVVLAGAAVLLEPALIPLLALAATIAASIILVDAAIALLGLSVMLLAEGLNMIALSAAGSSEGLKLLGEVFAKYGIAFATAAAVIPALGAGLIAFGAGCLVTGAGVLVLAAAFIVLGVSLVALSAGIALFMVTIDAFKEKTDNLVKDIPDMIERAFQNLIDFISRLADIIDEYTPKLIEACKKLFKSIINAGKQILNEAVPDFKKIGGNLIDGLINGIKNMAGKVKDAVKGVANKAVDTFKDILGIHSPSRVAAEMGEFFDLGFVKGINKFASKVSDSTRKLGNNAINTISDTISNIADFMNSDVDYDPVIRPVMDLSNIQNGTREINAMMSREQTASVSADMNFSRVRRDQYNEQRQQALENEFAGMRRAIGNIKLDDERPVNVNVSLEGDANRLFRTIRQENDKFTKSNGRSALA